MSDPGKNELVIGCLILVHGQWHRVAKINAKTVRCEPKKPGGYQPLAKRSAIAEIRVAA